MRLFDVEWEFLKIFLLGMFLGIQLRKYFFGTERDVPWMTIKNMRFPFMNDKHKKIIPFMKK